MKLNKSFQYGVIALGGNLPSVVGMPADTLTKAILTLGQSGLVIRAVSRFFETPCFPAGAGPDYVNAAISFVSDKKPDDVLQLLHTVEAEFGRERVQRWGMRTLDLDLIVYGNSVLPDRETYQKWHVLPIGKQSKVAPTELVLPHPRLQDRAFVLVPMADIAGPWKHPILGVTIDQLLGELAPQDVQAVKPILAS